ncbi:MULTISPECIES: hypothetical protein [unclassified Yoonia]|uniref:hypothetical protein n=1 Tax=unclassified Yoonia TaxID=2629118 RepID=UPI002AFE98A1|nr:MULTISPECIES: hypothetical protein [unclassified Yoonia]
MFRLLLALIWLTVSPSAIRAQAQPDHVVIDATERLSRASGPRRAAAVEELVTLATGNRDAKSTTIRFGDTEWITLNHVPVQVSVSGDWGNHDVTCYVTLRFDRTRTGNDSWQVAFGVVEAGLDAAYLQSGDAAVQIAHFVETAMGDEPAPFVTGDGFINAACGPGPLADPALAEPAIIARIQRQNAACVYAIEDLGVQALNPDVPMPPACIMLVAMQRDYAGSLGLAPESLARLQECAPQIAAANGSDRQVDSACAGFLRGMAQQADATLGTCIASAGGSGSLMILDPTPYTFSAIYSGQYQRADCKGYTVQLRFNVTDDFAFVSALPTTSSCLLVEPEEPTFDLFFNREVDEKRLSDLIRLRVNVWNGGVWTIPLTFTQVENGHIRVQPTETLIAGSLYWLDVKSGENGIKSATGAILDAPPAVSLIVPGPPDEEDFTTVLRFHVSPVSQNPALTRIEDRFRAGVYQIVRDERLLRNRPTALRLWFDWPGYGDNVPYVNNALCMSVEVTETGKQDELLYPPRDTVLRPDHHYTQTDRRMGRHTVNFFNWRPADPIGSVTVTVKPQVYWRSLDADPDDVPEITVDHAVRFLEQQPANLELIVGFVEFDDYADAGWQGDMAVWRQNFNSVRRYAWQVMPINSVTVRYVGGFTPEELGVSFSEADEDDFAKLQREDWINGCDDSRSNPGRNVIQPECRASFFHRDMTVPMAAAAFGDRYCQSSHQVCFLMAPPTFGKVRDSSAPGRRQIEVSARLIDSEKRTVGRVSPIATDGQALTHEIAHSFGLNHLPLRQSDDFDFMAYTRVGGVFPDIDGILMALSGRDGAMKSSETGNADNPRFLAPVMFPNVIGETVAFMPTSQFTQLMDSIYGIGGSVFGPEQVYSHRWERLPYAEIQNRLSYPREISMFEDDELPSVPRLTQRLPLLDEPEADGIALSLVLLQTEETALPLAFRIIGAGTQRATDLSTGVPVGVMRLSFADRADRDVPFAAPSFARAMATQGDRLVAVDLDLFLPLDDAERRTLRRIALLDHEGELVTSLDIATLPEEPIQITQAIDPRGLLTLAWDTGLPQAPELAFLPAGQMTPVPLGMASHHGAVIDTAAAGLVGTGDLIVTLETVAGRWQSIVPVTLPSVLRVSETLMSDSGNPEMIVTFNRPLSEDLPSFSLLTAEGPIALFATVLDDQLVLTASADLPTCASYPVVAEGVLRDVIGTALSGRVDWTFATGGEDCAQVMVNEARLTLTGGGADQTLLGQVSMTETGYLLQFNGLGVLIETAQDAVSGLVSVAQGQSRRDLVLRYGGPENADGVVQIMRDHQGLHASFSARWGNRSVSGSFQLPD